MSGRRVIYRLRVPIRRSRRRRLAGSGRLRDYWSRVRQRVQRRLRGGFLPALIPLIAAAIGAVPGIASVALQARRH